jgi:cytochrome c
MKSTCIAFLLGLFGLATAPAASADELLVATKAGCMACHAKDKKVVGPAYQDVARKYKGQADAQAKLAAKVRKGSSGVYGPVPMPPSDAKKISDADLKAVIAWILKL